MSNSTQVSDSNAATASFPRYVNRFRSHKFTGICLSFAKKRTKVHRTSHELVVSVSDETKGQLVALGLASLRDNIFVFSRDCIYGRVLGKYGVGARYHNNLEGKNVTFTIRVSKNGDMSYLSRLYLT